MERGIVTQIVDLTELGRKDDALSLFEQHKSSIPAQAVEILERKLYSNPVRDWTEKLQEIGQSRKRAASEKFCMLLRKEARP
jgi:hypothetical protein